MTYFDDLKYNEFAKDTDSYFENVTRINFDIIHHECRGDKLQNPERYYRTIRTRTLKIMNNMFKIMQYRQRLNLNVTIFILNMLLLNNFLMEKLLLKMR